MTKEKGISQLKIKPQPAALLWGWLGVLPFVALTATNSLAIGEVHFWAAQILTHYGAIILTFMGGVHWGIALTTQDRNRVYLYTVGIMPSLISVVAILLPAKYALLVLVAGFIALLLYDLCLVRKEVLPAWYGGLRLNLTLTVALCLIIASATVWIEN